MVEPRRRFRFLKELAEGAFGKVYMAEMITAEGFSSIVALKLLHGKWAGHQEIAQRSRDEARLLGLLHHRNIVRVEDLTSINGQCAVIMEYLEGVDLKTLINYCRERNIRIPRRAAFEITSSVAGALEAAYNQVPLKGGAPLHVIHRDIKPSNVMVTGPGDVKVLDFGTARANFEEREAKTQALAFGSQAYMAPERLLGDPDTPAGDVFSLAVNLYELLTYQSFGKIFIRAERYENALEERLDAVDLSDLPDDVADMVRDGLRRMLAYDNVNRPTAGEVVDLMDNLGEAVNDGGLQRFCRQNVRACLESIPPVQRSEESLTGSTLFEDRGTGNTVFPPEPDDEEEAPSTSGARPVAPPAEEVDPAAEVPDRRWGIEPSHQESYSETDEGLDPAAQVEDAAQHTWPVETEDRRWEPPSEPAEAEPAPTELPVAEAPAQSWQPPSPVESAPRPVRPVRPDTAVLRPTLPETPSPKPDQGGGKGKLIAIAIIALLAIAGGVAGLVLSGGGEQTPPPRTPEPTQPATTAQPGGRYEIGPMDGTRGALRLSLASPAVVNLSSATGEIKQEWDGTGTLELVGVPPGVYRARIAAAGGDVVRNTVDVVAGVTCAYAFDAVKGKDWEARGCE